MTEVLAPVAESIAASHSDGRQDALLLAGYWRDVPVAPGGVTVDGVQISWCLPRIRACLSAIRLFAPHWLVLGEGPSDSDRTRLLLAARHLAPRLHVAVIGSDDGDASDRWLRRGCAAYLDDETSLTRTLSILRFVRDRDVVVFDRPRNEAASVQHTPPTLTPRETDIVDRIRLGRRNREIATELGIEVSTVDFHVRNVLAKLGARNRVEAASRADMLGI